MNAVGVVAALKLEARTLGSLVRRGDGPFTVRDGKSTVGEGTLVVVSGMGFAAAAVAARALIDAGATALVSWGMAGGLDPALRAGTICIPSVIVSRDGTALATDPRWRELVNAAINPPRTRDDAPCTVVNVKLLSDSKAIGDIAGKASAFRATGAVAVDLESLGVAQIATAYALPFIAVRAIVDTAGDTLSKAVFAASGAGEVQTGQVHISRLMLGILKSPRELAALVRLAQQYRAARKALMAVARSGALTRIA